MSLILKKPGGSLQGAVDSDIWYVPVVSGAGYNSDFVPYATTTQFTGIGAAMVAGKLYAFQATTDCWISQGANPTAAKAIGSIFVQKGVIWLIDGAQGVKLAVLQDVAGGNASLVEVTA